MKRMVNDILRSVGYEIKHKNPDPYEVQQSIIKISDPVILDVGAHVGLVTRKYRQLFPHAIIHSFEPFPPSYEKLKDRVGANNANTQTHNLALCDKNGSINFNVNSSAATNSILPTDPKGSKFWSRGLLETQQHLQVSTTTIDSFCEEQKIKKIDILKLDVQGAEFLVLSGAKHMLAQHLISVIYLEILMAPTYAGQRNLFEYINLLAPLGYNFFDFYNPVRKGHRLLQFDVLFVLKGMEELHA
jgi:FkbM family methyltransferase